MQTITDIIHNVEIENLTSWPLYFRGITTPNDIKIEPPGTFPETLEFDELRAQIRARNTIFTGTDAHGSHARIRIVDDEPRRALLGDESNNATILTFDAVKELLAIKDRVKFENRLKQLVVTDAEKRMIIELAAKAGVDDAPSWMRDMIEVVAGNHVKVLVS